MAFTLYDIREPDKVVLWAYDNQPVRAFESSLGTMTNPSYFVKVYRYDRSDNFEEHLVTTIRSFPNAEGFGVFNLRNVLSGCVYLEQSLLNSDEYETTWDSANKAPTANNQFKVKLCWGTTDNGSDTIETCSYHYVIAGSLLNEFTGSADSPWNDYVINQSSGKFLTMRPTLPFNIFLNTPTQVAYISDNDRYSVSFLATNNTAGSEFDVSLDRINVLVVAAFAISETFSITLQDVAYSGFGTQNDGEVVRELPCGAWDIANLKDSGGNYFYGSTLRGLITSGSWTEIRIYAEDGLQNPEGASYVRLLRASSNNIDGCTTPIQLKFLNKLGGYDYLSCFAYVEQSMEMTRNTYNKTTGNYNTANATSALVLDDPLKRSRVSAATNVSRKLRVATGHIDENLNTLVEQMLVSREVLATRFKGNGTDHEAAFYPVIITDTSFSFMYKETEKVIEYKFNIEYSNQPTPLA